MSFHVVMNVRMPRDISAETIEQMSTREHERAAELQHQKKWLDLRRVVGKWANVSIFDVDSPGELHEILESLPLYPCMQIDLTALGRHPGPIEGSR
jgi:muconolactone D-isomerase